LALNSSPLATRLIGWAHSLETHERGWDALPLTFVRCWPTTFTASFNDSCRKNTATITDFWRTIAARFEGLCRSSPTNPNDSANEFCRNNAAPTSDIRRRIAATVNDISTKGQR
jgi:hypothetical protein